jgi:hypothetical protein
MASTVVAKLRIRNAELRIAAQVLNSQFEILNFAMLPYGRGLWISIWADTQLDWRLISNLLQRSYRTVALKRMIAALEARE